jgi:hypothetical protein
MDWPLLQQCVNPAGPPPVTRVAVSGRLGETDGDYRICTEYGAIHLSVAITHCDKRGCGVPARPSRALWRFRPGRIRVW